MHGGDEGAAMLSINGPSLSTCQGVSRRKLLTAGGLGFLGLTLADLLRGQAEAAATRKKSPSTFGKAKSCLIIYLSGGASHHDTFDMKPDAPAEVRGEFNPIASNVPGMQLCEHLPMVARHLDKCTVVRSMSHRDNNHPSAVYWTVTGHEYPRASNLSENVSREDHPHIGCSLTAAEGKKHRAVPTFVTVPDYIAVAGPVRAGQHAGFLGSRFDPLVPRGDPNSPDFKSVDLGLVPTVTPQRLSDRRALLGAVNQQLRSLERNGLGRQYDNHCEKAFSVLASGTTQRAFDIQSEPDTMRERYGRNLFGQSILLGRRLVEAGVRLVHVNWIRIMEFGWDTHTENFSNLKNKLLPPMDRGFSALLEDMSASGLLKETLVILMGEFGRSPKITQANAGREHWASVYSILLAGAGIPGGRHYGSSDRIGAYPREKAVSPGQLAATIFHALGVDPASQVPTLLERPYQICDETPVLDFWG
jgi:Protein of unknown function (DUF1501)